MNNLETEIRTRIATDGPISIADYMALCLTHPQEGYYTSRHPIGGNENGDFITAPEVSQMFGELIGVWCMEAWRALGSPDLFYLVELGPGRGTLMRDLLRAGQAVPDFLSAANICLVELSPTLKKQQAQLLEKTGAHPVWYSDIEQLPPGPSIIIANEFLDALPFRQWVKHGNSWHERAITLEDNKLAFTLRPNKLPKQELPLEHEQQDNGAVFETAPARESIIATLAHKFTLQTGAALFIDYGHIDSGFGDTFQAIKNHQFCDPLETPGEADLTSHVDFDPLIKIAISEKCSTPATTTQGNFLLSLGLLERAGALGSNQGEETQNELRSAVERLAGSEQMGQLFKAMAFGSPPINWPGFE